MAVKVIEEKHDHIKEKRCNTCNSLLEYDVRTDIVHNFDEEEGGVVGYIKCLVCDSKIIVDK